MAKIFIDGSEGTTGLRIFERFQNRTDIELLKIPSEQRKDPEVRKKFINESDITFLCLPDVAAVEAVSLVENPNVRIIDASTAHRTLPDWAYGFPELSKQHREAIATGKRVAVPDIKQHNCKNVLNGVALEYPPTYPIINGNIASEQGDNDASTPPINDANSRRYQVA